MEFLSHPENLNKDDYYTIVDRVSRTDVINEGGIVSQTTIERKDRSYFGDILKIVAVDPPFVAAKPVSGVIDKVINFDIRQVKFKKLSEEYVEAILEGEEEL